MTGIREAGRERDSGGKKERNTGLASSTHLHTTCSPIHGQLKDNEKASATQLGINALEGGMF